MAIKIPSKNIYEINNPKIRDNLVDNVSVEQTVITPNNEYEVPVFEKNILTTKKPTYSTSAKVKRELATTAGVVGASNYAMSASYLEFGTVYESNIDISFEKLFKNGYISKVYDLTNLDKENNIRHSISLDVVEEDIEMTFDVTSSIQNQGIKDLIDVGTLVSVNIVKTTKTNTTMIPSTYLIKDTEGNIVNVGIIKTTTANIGNANAGFENSIKEEFLENISIVSITNENEESYSVSGLKVLSGIHAMELSYEYVNGGVVATPPPTTIVLKGKRKIYTPKEINITIYGDKVSINLTDGSVTYGNGNKPFSLSGNELLQDSGRDVSEKIEVWVRTFKQSATTGGWNCEVAISPDDAKLKPNDILYYTDRYGNIKKAIVIEEITLTSSSNGYKIFFPGDKINTSLDAYWSKKRPITERLANNILLQYSKGKETATLLCSISDYYDESGEKIIDTKTNKMSFRLHDEVIPYVFGANGQDQPMSKHQDGTAKVFEVVGSNMIYDGAVWQELTLQEKAQNT